MLLGDSIKKLQGSVNHQGKKPYRLMKSMRSMNAQVSENDSGMNAEVTIAAGNDGARAEKKPTRASLSHEIDVMDKRLKQAVLEEDFEEAARLRDYIKDLRSRIEGADDNA